MAEADIHLIGCAQGQPDGCLLVHLGAHHHAVPVAGGQAVLGTPLGDL